MQELKIQVAQLADAPAIAVLANQHTYQQLNEDARQGGFLTGAFTTPVVAAMLASVPSQVAYAGSELAGFLLNSKLAADQYPPLIQSIINLLPTLYYQERALTAYQWFFYGPVLVQPAYRGLGLLPRLFAASQRTLAGQYELGIAFIARENVASLDVHTRKLGLERVGELLFQGTVYVLLAFAVS